MTHVESTSAHPGGSRIESGLRPIVGATVRDYQPVRVLGRGGCAIVYEAEHPDHGLVALKIGDSPVAGEETARRLIREADLETRVSHPNVIRVFEVGRTEDGRPFVVMERLDGIDLESLLTKNGPLPVDAACAIALQTLDALGAVHALGIVHRDLKPTNLMLTFSNDAAPVVKLIDFGVAYDRDGERLTRTGMIVGTPVYLAPEQARGELVDHRVDLWAVGVVLYELLTGRSPVEGESIDETIVAILHGDLPSVRALRPDVPHAVAEVVSRAMARDPDDRFANASAMRRALDAALRTHAIPVSPETLGRYHLDRAPKAISPPSERSRLETAESVPARPSERPPASNPARSRIAALAAKLGSLGSLAPLVVAALLGLVFIEHGPSRSSATDEATLVSGRTGAIPTVAPTNDEPKLDESNKGSIYVGQRGAPTAALSLTRAEYARGLIAHARLASVIGLYDLAYALYGEATRVMPTNALAWNGLSRAAQRAGHEAEGRAAMTRYRELVRASPRRASRLRWR